jgi:glycerate kinase
LIDAVKHVTFVVASDVDNPLTGPSGAAAVYGPQKGATPEDVELLDRALSHYADLLARDVGVDVRDRPGAGAAGGLGAGLMAFLRAEVRRGIDVVLEVTDFEHRVEDVDLVITGEGKLDRQSLRGKTVAGVVEACRRVSVAAVVVCGQAEVGVDGVPVHSMAARFGMDRALNDAGPALHELVADIAAEEQRP